MMHMTSKIVHDSIWPDFVSAIQLVDPIVVQLECILHSLQERVVKELTFLKTARTMFRVIAFPFNFKFKFAYIFLHPSTLRISLWNFYM
jgi:hypothetical protein